MNYKYIFGPIPSRRLGLSLGVDLVPNKTCNLNCTYCECGASRELFLERKSYIDFELLKAELRAVIPNIKTDYITLSGAGEPTLNKDLGEIIQWLKENTPYPIAVITNSILLSDDTVLGEITKADVIIPSIDAVSESAFRLINRPHKSITNSSILTGLKNLSETFGGDILLELFLVPGVNDRVEELALLRDFISTLKITELHLNTLARPGAIESLRPLSKERLSEVKSFFEEKLRCPIVTLGDNTNNKNNGNSGNSDNKKNFNLKDTSTLMDKSRIINLFQKRGYYLAELEAGLEKEELGLISSLLTEGLLIKKSTPLGIIIELKK